MNNSLRFLLAYMLTLAFTVNAAGNAEIVKLTEKLTPLKGTQPAQWRVLWMGNAATEASISWSTAEVGKTHKVYFGETTKLGNEINCQRNGEYSRHKKEIEKVSAAFYHHANLKSLKPSTKYFFVMESDGVKSKQLYFITAPESGTDFSIIHGGDSRSGHLVRCQINVMMSKMIKKNPDIIAFAHGGDYIVSGKYWQQWRLWLSHNELTNGEDGRVLPIIPARGNHDDGPLYKEVFNIDPKQPDWYTTNIGKDVALVTLDTNVSGGGAQQKWLEEELKRLRPKSNWLLTQYHRPLYPAVKSPKSHTKIFCPVFDMYKVDLGLESDGHCIKRTIPIKDNKPDPTGTVYVGEGGLGVGQRKPKADLWYLKGGVVGNQHHVMTLDFKKDSLRIKIVLLSGKIFDDHSLKVRPGYAMASKSNTSKKTSTAKISRKPFKLNKERLEKIDEILLATLSKLSKAEQLKKVNLSLSKTKKKIILVKIESNLLTFKLSSGTKTASFKWQDLTNRDHAVLACLIAESKPDSKTANALAVLYQENFGTRSSLNKYIEKTSPETLKTIESKILAKKK